jgi:hypothetical protein
MADLRREAGRHVGGRIFTREGWHGTIIEDVCALPFLRPWGGLVPKGKRDLFGHIIASQLARIVLPGELPWNIIETCRRILPADYIDRELMGHSASVLARAIAREPYRYSKARLIDDLEITRAEERRMLALISDDEKRCRHLQAKTDRLRAAGMPQRETWLAQNSAEREKPWEAEGISRATWYRRRQA